MDRLLKRIISSRKVWLLGIDVVFYLAVSLVVYLLSRTVAYSMPVDDFGKYALNTAVLLMLICFYRLLFRVYRTIWRYSSTVSYLYLVLSDAAAAATMIIVSRLFKFYNGFWFAVLVASLNALAALSARFCYRLVYKRRNNVMDQEKPRIRVAIVGAGQVGVFLAADLCSNPHSFYQPMCFIDDDKNKIGGNIAGLRVYSEKDAAEVIGNFGINEVIIAVTKADNDQLSELYRKYEAIGCKVKIYDAPVYREDVQPGTGKRVIRQFQIEDLLFRQPLTINNEAAFSYYENKVVLVTGGGGSIGSELCRQLAKCHLKQLIIFDIYENNAYDIQLELQRRYGTALNLVVEIGSVRDRVRLDWLFRTYRPDIVFHAAAHKHVPLMEHSSCEAIKNNVLGTYNVADMAELYAASKMILISTDKAVNPTNIMGASKRLCEMVIQCRTDSKTSFAAVRFGNVLGSNGSVIPLFKRQIAEGGPVTITDKRIIRYFMTIPEASQLVMQAGAMAKKGELYVLDMGKPVHIYDLACNMIKLSGFRPEVDIPIKEIGLRPGEKLYEELLMKNESLDKTENNMIFIERDAPLTREQVEEKLALLRTAVEKSDKEGAVYLVKETVAKVVPTYHEPAEINAHAEDAMMAVMGASDR